LKASGVVVAVAAVQVLRGVALVVVEGIVKVGCG
jgi:hypothetical protein